MKHSAKTHPSEVSNNGKSFAFPEHIKKGKGDVAIIGAGISGLLTALLMSDHCPDVQITVIEAQPAHSMMCSHGPAAETLFVPPAVTPSSIHSVKGSIICVGSLLASWRWWRFVGKSIWRKKFNNRAYGTKCRAVFLETLRAHPELAQFCHKEGVLHVARDQTFFNKYRKWVASLEGTREAKYYRVLDRAETLAMEPALEGQVMAGAILSTRDGYVQLEKFNEAVKVLLEARGVTFLFKKAVVKADRRGTKGKVTLRLATTDGQGGLYADPETRTVTSAKVLDPTKTEAITFDKVVLCAGMANTKLSKIVAGQSNTGELVGVQGFSVTGRAASFKQTAVPERAIVYRKEAIFCRALFDDENTSADDKFYRVGGGVILSNRSKLTVNKKQFAKTFNDVTLAQTLLNKADPTTPSQIWVGNRPCTPKNRPLVRAMAGNRVFYNTGHGANGYVYPWYSTIELLRLMFP